MGHLTSIVKLWCQVLIATSLLPASDSLFLHDLFGSGYRIGEEYFDVCRDTCRLTMSCWMVSGTVLKGHLCGSAFHVCCSEPRIQQQPYQAEARKITYWSSGGVTSNLLGSEMEEESFPDLRFGPVYNEPECGMAKMSKRRVVGGSSAGFGTFPWQALIRIKSSRCGGALVGPRHVVTAGHCVNPLGKDILESDTPPKDVAVYLGEYSLYNNGEPLPRQKINVEKIHLHPYYEFTPQADRYDVAVLKLDRPAMYDWHVSPVCLPLRDQEPEPGTKAMVAGWGATHPDSTTRPRELQAVDVKVVESSTCERWHRSNRIYLKLYPDMMCAGHREGGKDACQGDSGGPLMTRDPKTGAWTLIGLVSAGYSCAKPGQPGIYHKISKSSDWISYVKTYL